MPGDDQAEGADVQGLPIGAGELREVVIVDPVRLRRGRQLPFSAVVQSLVQQRFQQPTSLSLCAGQPTLQLIADSHQLIHLRNDSMLFS